MRTRRRDAPRGPRLGAAVAWPRRSATRNSLAARRLQVPPPACVPLYAFRRLWKLYIPSFSARACPSVDRAHVTRCSKDAEKHDDAAREFRETDIASIKRLREKSETANERADVRADLLPREFTACCAASAAPGARPVTAGVASACRRFSSTANAISRSSPKRSRRRRVRRCALPGSALPEAATVRGSGGAGQRRALSFPDAP